MFNKIISSPLVKVPARYGAIAGLLCIICLITLFYMGKSPFLIDPYKDFRVPLFGVLLFFCLKEIRDFYKGGMIKMWEAMSAGMLFLAVTAIVAAVGILIFGTIRPAFVTDYIAEFAEQIKSLDESSVKQIGKDTLDSNLKALPATTIGDLASLYVWQTFVTGFFITVIISVILRRQPKTN